MANEMSKLEWKQKDDLKRASIVSQSCLERAVETVMGLGASGLDKFTLENVKKRVTETHDYYCELVYQKTEELAFPKPKTAREQSSQVTEKQGFSGVVSDLTCPTPTVPQQEALKIVEQETKWTASQVYAKFQRFPTADNVKACIKLIKEN